MDKYKTEVSDDCKDSVQRLKRAELQQIERHKYYMSLRRGEDVGFEAAACDWLENHALKWREQRQRRMLKMQREEMSRYKWIQSERAQRDLGGAAVLEWIQKYAAPWRNWYDNEFVDEDDIL